MARFNPARRLRRKRRQKVRISERPPWERKHHPWTIEGRIEDVERMVRGLKSPRIRNPDATIFLKLIGFCMAAVIGVLVVVEVVSQLIGGG